MHADVDWQAVEGVFNAGIARIVRGTYLSIPYSDYSEIRPDLDIKVRYNKNCVGSHASRQQGS